MAEASDAERIATAGYMKWAVDTSGRTYIAPDGFRTMTFEQAVAELDQADEERAA